MSDVGTGEHRGESHVCVKCPPLFWLPTFIACCRAALFWSAVPACEMIACSPLHTCGLQEGLENDEQRVGADIIRRALPYALKLIARNAGVNGSVVVQKVGRPTVTRCR